MTTPEPPTEPQQQCYELMAHCKATAAELTQARFENEALQRRLAEYASENQRLRDAIAGIDSECALALEHDECEIDCEVVRDACRVALDASTMIKLK
jgi:hypothetical protein